MGDEELRQQLESLAHSESPDPCVSATLAWALVLEHDSFDTEGLVPHLAGIAVLVVLWVAVAGCVAQQVSPVNAQTTTAATRFEPAADHPAIVAVQAAVQRLNAAMKARDMEAVEALMAPDLIVHAPVNRVVDRANVLARLEAGEIAYDEDGVSTVELAAVRGDLVVMAGGGVLRPVGKAPNAGKTIRRRWTSVWKQYDGQWKLFLRQATVYSVE